MEQNTIPVNTANISLSDYNVTKANLDTTRDLLSKALAKLEVLENEEPKNKLVVVERKQYDERYGGTKTVEKLTFDVQDPVASGKLLEVISKVETSELSNQIDEQKSEIRTLKNQIDEYQLNIDRLSTSTRRNIRDLEERQEDKVHKIERAHTELVRDLTEDKADLVKALSDLKKDKTQQQVELARQEELDELNEKINMLETFKSNVENVSNNPFKLKSFLNSVSNAARFINYNQWMNKLKNRTYSAMERVEAFAIAIKNVGKKEKDVVYTPANVMNSVFYGNSPYVVSGTSNW